MRKTLNIYTNSIALVLIMLCSLLTIVRIDFKNNPMPYKQSDYMLINGKVYNKRSTVDFKRYTSETGEQFTFVTVQSVDGAIRFEQYETDYMTLDEFEISFAKNFVEEL